MVMATLFSKKELFQLLRFQAKGQVPTWHIRIYKRLQSTKIYNTVYLVNLSMATKIYQYPPMAQGNGPRMSSPQTVNDHEGGIIYNVYAGVWICLA
jgi:hypothetical protein